MRRSAKLGITSIVLLLIALVTPFLNWQFPIPFVSAVLSVLFAVLAAQQGSRWWLTVSCRNISNYIHHPVNE